MEKKQTGLIATIATAVLCGLPGLCSLCFGAIFALVGFIPGSDIDVMGSSDPASAIGTGVGMLCGGIILIAIPIVVYFLTMRKKPQTETTIDAEVTDTTDESLPPTS